MQTEPTDSVGEAVKEEVDAPCWLPRARQLHLRGDASLLRPPASPVTEDVSRA